MAGPRPHKKVPVQADSVMMRTMSGVIRFWNRSAEGVYGWRKEEAIGRISHDLLRTEFPRPLEKIESELARKGRWEGRLVHTTRDGRRVTVQSRWILDRAEFPGTVVERNTIPTGSEVVGKAKSKAVAFANLVIAIGATLCAAAFLYSLYAYDIAGTRSLAGWPGVFFYKVLPAVAAVLILAGLRLRPGARVNIALVLFSVALSVYGAESLLRFWASRVADSRTLWSNPRSEEERQSIRQVASQFNVEFDMRNRLQVIRDLRAQSPGVPPVPSIAPIGLLRPEPGGHFEPVLSIGGEKILPLGGISNRLAVLCNETGTYAIYETDERGFHNPRGIWDAGVTVAAVGDSFTEGSCVPSEKSLVALIRNHHAGTLNLGMSGEGPLLMYAAVREYLAVVKPKIVLWFYYEENDFEELAKERNTPFLQRYLQGPFTQGLLHRQPEIDQVLLEHVESEMTRALAQTNVETTENVFHPGALLDFVKLAHLRGALGLVYGRAVGNPRDEYSRDQMDLFRSILLQAKTSVQEWGGTMYFVYLPARDRYANGQDYYRQAVLNIVSEIAIPIIDVHARFQREGDPLRFFPFRRFGHYNEEGNRVVAEEVLSAVAVKQ
jgi:hypothetical protein